MREDRPFELLERGSGFDPELVDQPTARPLIALQRIRLAPRPIQREHQLGMEALVQRMLRHERLKLADQRRVPAEREVRVDSVLECPQPLLLQPADRNLRERLIRDVRQRRPAPQRQPFAQPPRGSFWIA